MALKEELKKALNELRKEILEYNFKPINLNI